VNRLILSMHTEMKRVEIQERLALKHDDYFRVHYIIPAIEEGFIQMKYPDSPNHPKQKYILTQKGIALQKLINK